MNTQPLRQIAVILLLCLGMTTTSFAESSNTKELSKEEKGLVPICYYTASGDLNKLKTSLHQGLDAGLTINEIKEALVHSHAYTGFPRALLGINTFIAVMEEREATGKIDTIGKAASPAPADYDRNAYGHKVRNSLVGRDISKRSSGYPVFTQIIDTYLVEHLFGDIFVRDVLSHQQRELVTISVLAALPGTQPMFRGHLGIAKRMGYSEEQLYDFITVLRNQVGSFAADRAEIVLAESLKAKIPESKPLQVFPATEAVVASSDYFSGKATVEARFKSEATDKYRGGIVNFDKGARTAWHTHPAGQTLIITAGRGLVQSEGADIQEVGPGDVVWIPANSRHWHGATADSFMSHVAISEPVAGATVAWQEKVSDEESAK